MMLIHIKTSWKLYLVLSQAVLVQGMTYRGFFAKKGDKEVSGPAYKIITGTATELEGFAKCLKDEGCSSFLFQQETKRTLLYKLTAVQNLAVYTIWSERCPHSDGCLYSQEFNYLIHVGEDQKLNWGEANRDCKSRGGKLASLDTEEKFADIKQLLGDSPHTYWVGGKKAGSSYIWVNGKEIIADFWHPGQPNLGRLYVSTGREYFGSFGLDDDNGSIEYYYICEYYM